MLTDEERDARHELQHAGLKRMEDRIEKIMTSALANAHRLKLHAPRKYAKRSTYSQRVSYYHAYRAHLKAMHPDVKVSTFATMDELLALHDKSHNCEHDYVTRVAGGFTCNNCGTFLRDKKG